MKYCATRHFTSGYVTASPLRLLQRMQEQLMSERTEESTTQVSLSEKLLEVGKLTSSVEVTAALPLRIPLPHICFIFDIETARIGCER